MCSSSDLHRGQTEKTKAETAHQHPSSPKSLAFGVNCPNKMFVSRSRGCGAQRGGSELGSASPALPPRSRKLLPIVRRMPDHAVIPHRTRVLPRYVRTE